MCDFFRLCFGDVVYLQTSRNMNAACRRAVSVDYVETTSTAVLQSEANPYVTLCTIANGGGMFGIL